MTGEFDPEPRTRSSDDPRAAQRIEEARREGRIRTIVMSVVISGAAALLVTNLAERQSYNSQQDRSRKNCSIQQQHIQLDVANYAEQADRALGNAHPVWQKAPIKPFTLKGTPFAKFAPLIKAQAVGNRKRAHRYAALKQDCRQVFPHKKPIPLVG